MATRTTRTTNPMARAYTTNPPRLRPVWTPATFRTRALELMETHHASWWDGRCRAQAFTPEPEMALAWVAISVASATIDGLFYAVRYDAASDFATCDCAAGAAHQPCWHAGVGLDYGRRAADAQRALSGSTGQQRALQIMRDHARWEDNDTAILPSL